VRLGSTTGAVSERESQEAKLADGIGLGAVQARKALPPDTVATVEQLLADGLEYFSTSPLMNLFAAHFLQH